MISSNEIEKNKSQEKLVSDLEALKKKLENNLELKKTKTVRKICRQVLTVDLQICFVQIYYQFF